jgi:hypothetical protein
MLAEIERRLAAEDPGLATRLSSFRRPGPAAGLRTPRGRIIMLACMIALIAIVSAVVYLLVPFRPHNSKAPSNTPQGSHLVISNPPKAGAGNAAATGS